MAGYDYGTYRPVYTTGGQGVGPYTDQWGKPRHSSHPDVAEPGRGYGYATDSSWQRRPSSPARGGYGYADQASRIAPSTGVNWGQQPHQTGHYSGTSGGYNDYNDYNNKPAYKNNGRSDNYDDYSNKPAYKNNGRSDNYDDYSNKPAYKNNGRSDNYDDYYRKNETGNLGPAVNTISSRAKPSRTAYSAAALPVRGDGRLSIPTDDMERALHYLKESAKTSPWPRT